MPASVPYREGDALTPFKGNSANTVRGTLAVVHLGASQSYAARGLEARVWTNPGVRVSPVQLNKVMDGS